jgi:CRP-like cAMP-binding protein
MEQKRNNLNRQSSLSDADITVLSRVPLFQGMKPDKIVGLLENAYTMQANRNTLLFLQDDDADKFFVLLEGWVKLFRETDDGNESVIGVFARGESFAEAAIFDEGVFPVCAMAVENSRIVVIPAAAFKRKISDNPEYALNMMAAMSRHQRGLVQQIEQLAVKSTTERVALFLSRLCPNNATEATIQLPLDKGLIARRLGMQPETFSRALAKLRDVGVQTNGQQVEIPDIGALRHLRDGNRAAF